jgi:exopolysaccharide production protein ExoQ
MNASPRLRDWLLLGSCAFILTGALLSLILNPAENATEGNPVWQLILTVSYSTVALLLVPYYRETLYVLRRNWFLAALVLLALVSCLWAQMPLLVLRRGIAVFGTTLFGVALALRLSLEEQLRLLRWVFRIIAVLSLACIVLLPGYGISSGADNHGEWRGIFDHKNRLGSIMALSILVEWQLPAHSRLDRIIKGLALLVSALLLVFSDSVTPLIALVAALLFMEVYKLASLRLRLPTYAIFLASAVFGVVLFLGVGGKVMDALGRSSDLTGRTQIWSMVLSFIPRHPVLGYGYSGFWNGASTESGAIDQIVGAMVMYSHNGFLEILLNLGAVGLLLTLVLLGTGVKRAYSFSDFDRSSVSFWPLAFIFYFLLHNLAECTILFQDLEWAVCVATVVGTDATLFAPEARQEEDFLLATSEEFT